MSSFVRVDDRLIHGQVVHGWLPVLKIQKIVVADPSFLSDPLQQEVAKLSLPSHIQLFFVSPRMVGEVIQEDVPSMVLFRTPIEAKESYDVGFHFERLNLGNLHFSTGKIPLRKTFCCSSEEMEALKYLYRKGVRLLYQPSPDNFPQVIIFSD